MAKKHGDHPEIAKDVPAEVRAAAQRIANSLTAKSLERLLAATKGRVVANSIAGRSGFVLLFADESWAASFLAGDRLDWAIGSGVPTEAVMRAIDSTAYSDASAPIDENLPYADESCDIAAEVANCHGQPVTTLSIGEDSFNFCFPNGLELDTHVVGVRRGGPALRVFWEQW